MLSDVQRAIAARPQASRLLVLSDFDGTIADFHPDPAAPRPLAHTAALLTRLAARDDMSFGVVSGRRIADLRSRIDLPATAYFAGLHGLEVEIGERRWQHPELAAARTHVRTLVARLDELRGVAPGVVIEDKDASVAVHVRPVAPDRRDDVLARADAAAAEWVGDGRLRRLHGNLVLEFLPNIDANKGDAVRWIARDVDTHHGVRPWIVYVGDDVTDEDAFGAIERGLGVLVGDRETRAGGKVANTREVDALLEWLADLPAAETRA